MRAQNPGRFCGRFKEYGDRRPGGLGDAVSGRGEVL